MLTKAQMKEKEVGFVVYYSKEGDPLHIEAVSPCKVVAEGKKQLTPKKIHDIICENGNKVEVKTHSLLHVYGSPGCIIYLFGIPICICCS